MKRALELSLSLCAQLKTCLLRRSRLTTISADATASQTHAGYSPLLHRGRFLRLKCPGACLGRARLEPMAAGDDVAETRVAHPPGRRPRAGAAARRGPDKHQWHCFGCRLGGAAQGDR